MKMNRMGLRTIIILLVVLSSPSSLEYLDSDSNCLEDTSSVDIEYRCPKENPEIILHNRSPWKKVSLDCIKYTRLFVDKEILPKLDLKEYIHFELTNCYLNVSFYEILSKFNMNNVKSLTFSDCDPNNNQRIIKVTKEMFKYMESIEYLRLEDSTLNLSVDFLENTPNLRYLSLKRNRLTQISKYSNHVPKLEYLVLRANQIDFILDGVFEDFENLVELDASDIKLTSITKNTFKGPKGLQVLMLHSNHIENIEKESFADMHKLEHIEFRHNPNLVVLPDYLFANLTSLHTIDLSFNNLREIPEYIFSNCSKLRDLTLKRNHLSTIPGRTFLNLTNLKQLDISKNVLETLSDQLFSSLYNLEELYVSKNRLTALDSNIFHNMGNLNILDLSYNNIGFIHHLAFRGLEYSLTQLDLSQNQLNSTYHTGDITPFHECPNLEILILRNNKIREYTGALFKLEKIKKIDLSYNLIKDLRVSDFIYPHFNSYLQVELTHNEIQYVNFEARYWPDREPLTGHTTINLYDNPIVCDCSNIDLIRYNNDEMESIKKLVDIKQDRLTCSDKNISEKYFIPNPIGCPILQGCPSPCTCTYKPYYAAVIVDCSFNNLTSYPKFSFNDIKYQQAALILRGNRLNTGPVEDSNYENFTYWDLSQNHISEMTWIPLNIKELNLKKNHLRKLDSHFLSLLKNRTSLKRINLENNMWDCDCDASDLQEFLLLNYVKVNSSNVYCHNSTTKIVTLTDLCKTSALLTVLLPIVLIILLCVAVALALYYRYQKEIKIYLYAQNLCLWFVTEEELDKDKTYDVFISCAHQDENFVLDYLLPELEHGQTPFKVCVHTRDWVPGKFITTQVINSVKDSRRTLMVLSNNFVDSLWGKLQFRTAHTEAISGRARVVVVLYGDLNEDKLDDELKCYIKTNTCVKWGDKYFWNKLKYALPHSR